MIFDWLESKEKGNNWSIADFMLTSARSKETGFREDLGSNPILEMTEIKIGFLHYTCWHHLVVVRNISKKIPDTRPAHCCGARPGPQKLYPSLDGFGWDWEG
ncbi:hypothetical protein DSO57_1009850 [Entomophthora muscae]|uniref:Uncharacterized protein n=1 Tax=Entomophthora muscae TaxID=34485 RepID=A0ACC2TUK8_9FUNG|nr:hypothetical protein DSO57_1009850 [Entomophthora muscae]